MSLRRIVWVALAALLLATPAGAAARPGEVDRGFGGGVVLTGFGAERNSDSAEGVVVLGDGRVAAAGLVDSDSGPVGIGVSRYLPSGELDASFGDGGRVITNPVPMLGRAWCGSPTGSSWWAGPPVRAPRAT